MSPGRTPRPSRRAGRPGCASAAADPRTAGGAPPARPPPRRPQSRRSPDTSTVTAAARRPRSASGSQSTAQDASPDARDASSEDRAPIRRWPLTIPSLAFQIRRRPNGAPALSGCNTRPCSPFIRRRRPRTRIAHHLPRPIRRQPHQPAGLAHICLTIPRRTLPVEPPQVPVLAARARRDHELLLRHQPCRRVLSPKTGAPALSHASTPPGTT